MARLMDEGPDYLLGDIDQFMPQYKEEADVKPQIKLEELDDYQDPFLKIMTDSIISNSSSNSSSNSNSNCTSSYNGYCNSSVGITTTKPYDSGVCYSSNQGKSNASCVGSQVPVTAFMASSTTSSFFKPAPSPSLSPSSSPLQMTSVKSPQVPHFSALTPTKFSHSTRNNTQACKVPSSCSIASPVIDFLTDTDMALPGFCSPEANLQYTDLDSQQMSLYEDFQPISSDSKPGAMMDDNKRLEEAFILMMDTISKDCDSLKVSYDPLTWTSRDVNKWVSWVCQRNGVADVSDQLLDCDGATLCSMTPDMFYFVCGDAGVKLSNELELWKAANSCFPNQIYCANINDQVISQTQPMQIVNPQTYTLAKCSSPALSSCSSNHDSNTSSTSTHSDPSDDESGSGYRILHSSSSSRFRENNGYSKILHKIPSGRGHKQTIHLWQFLKELLVSKDVNYSDCIRWLDRTAGIFKIEDSKKVASLWGARKNRPAMNYDKLSRSMRQYYKKGIIKKTEMSKRLVYQFCPEYV